MRSHRREARAARDAARRREVDRSGGVDSAAFRHRPLARALLASTALTAALATAALIAKPAEAADFVVSNNADSGAGSFRQAIIDSNAAGGTNNIIINSGVGTITLTSGDLPTVANNATIVGNNNTLSGNNQFRGLFIGAFSGTTQTAVSVSISDLTITNARAQGGQGGGTNASTGSGGGGAGLGGAIFVADQATLTVSNVTLTNSSAAGGAGGFNGNSGGGGGGMGGNGGTTVGGGGGLGVGADGGDNIAAGSAGIATGGSAGGTGGSGGGGGTAGGANGGGGGGGVSVPGGGSGAGGGVGGANGVAGGGAGGAGGFGGGGGAGKSGVGGAGGFGGGGGAGNAAGGGAGGFGGGGGGSATVAGIGGFGGGNGGGSGIGGGGGGAGLGGAVFVQQGGTLNVAGAFSANGSSVTAGAAGPGGSATAGSAFGSGLFLQGNGTITFQPGAGQAQTVSNVIADQTGSGGTGADAGSYSLTKSGAGTLTLSAANTYSGGTTFNGGTLAVSADNNLGAAAGGLAFGGGTLRVDSNLSTSRAITLNAGGGAFNTNADTSLTGTITGTGGLTKTGNAVLFLTGNNSYQGGTAINGGTLAVSADNNLGAASGGLSFDFGSLDFQASLTTDRAITLNAGGGFFDASGNDVVLAGNITGSGALINFGSGSLTLTGTNDYTGGTSNTGTGVLQLGDSVTTAKIVGDVNNSGFFFIVNADTSGITSITNFGATTFQNTSSAGSADIRNGGGGSLLTFADNSTAANAKITTNSGALTQFTSNSNGGNAQFVTDAGGVVDFSGTSGPLGNNQISAGSIDGGGSYRLGGNQLTVGSNNLSTTVSGTIEDGGTFGGTGASLVKVGTGTLTLTGVNTYSGGTTINGGTLAVSADNNLGAAAGGLTFDGGTLQFNSGFTSNRAITLNAGGGTIDIRNNTATLGGTIGGAGGLTKIGVGRLRLTGSSNYSGATNVNVGTLQAGAANAFSASSAFIIGANGTLDLNGFSQTIGSLAGAGRVNLGTATLTVGNDNTSTASSAFIFGDGGLTKSGTGTQTISGANNYSGLTTVLAGTLRAAAANTFAQNSAVSIVGGATLDLNGFNQSIGTLTGAAGSAVTLGAGTLRVVQSSSSIFGGTISGTGGLTVTGLTNTTTLNLAGSTNYSGATTVSGGVLHASFANVLSAASAFLVGGTLSLGNNQTIGSLAGSGRVTLGTATLTTGGDNSDTTFGGVISGTGGLVKTGTGTMTLSGSNTFSGGTTIAGGTLRLANNRALGTGALTTTGSVVDYGNAITISNAIVLNSNTTQLSVQSTASATQSGAISELNGMRPLEKIGDGTLILSAVNSYTGATTVSAGTLVVNGSIASSAVTVGAGARLAGSGTVGATTILSGGTFAPGPTNTAGAMTVAGNLAFQSGALYLVQVNPATASSANVTTGGSATLAGTVNAAFLSGRYVTRNYTILSAAGGLNGTFNALTTTNLPAGFSANLSYSATNVTLNLTATLGALATGGLSENQRNVAGSLNNFFNNGGALPPNFVTVFGLTGGALGNALSSLSGEAATGAQQAAFQIGNQFLSLMLDPFVDGRSGVAGAGGPALGFAPEQATLPDEIALAYSSVLKAPQAPAAPAFEQRWTAWGAAYGGGNKTSGDPAVLGSHDLSAGVAGFAGGLDYRLTPHTVVGVALAGGGTSWNLVQGLGGGKSDAFQAGVYGATRWGAAYLAGAFAYTNHWMSTDRFAFASDHLTASFNAQSLGGRVEGGYRVATWYGGVTPYAAIQAQSFRTPSYSETDGSGLGFALAYNARTGTDTRSELGARFDRLIALNASAALALRGRLAWAHDWVSDPSLAAVFQTLPGASFIVNGAVPAKDSALVSAGSELRLASGVTLIGKFDGEFASRSSTYAGTGTVRYAW